MARLVPAACPNCAASVKVEPGKEQARCEYCGHSLFVQRPVLPRPPTLPAFQPRPNFGRVWLIVLSATLLPLVLAFGIWRTVWSRVHGVVPTARPTAVTAPPRPAAAGPEDRFFEDAVPLGPRLARRLIGHATSNEAIYLENLILYDTYAVVEAQDPRQREHIDSYVLRGGAVELSGAVPLSPEQRRDLPTTLFRLSDVDLSLVPGLVGEATRRAGVEEGKVSHIIIERGVSGRGKLGFRVYVSGPRDSAMLTYDEKGKLRR